MTEKKTTVILVLAGTLSIIGAVAGSLHVEILTDIICILYALLMIGFTLHIIFGLICSMIVSFNHVDDDDYIDLLLPYDVSDARHRRDERIMKSRYDNCMSGRYMSRELEHMGAAGRLSLKWQVSALASMPRPMPEH